MLYIKKKRLNNFSLEGLNSNDAFLDKTIVDTIKTTGPIVGGMSGSIAGAGLGVSASAGHALSNMDNGLLGGAISTAVPMAGGLLVGGLPGAALHGASGLGGYLYGRFKKNKTKKKQTLGDALKTGTVVGLGGMLTGGALGTAYGENVSDKMANDKEYIDFIKSEMVDPQPLFSNPKLDYFIRKYK